MLCELSIENVAVIEKATVLFGEGFNVLTGETGAGKSILIDSINAILGNRTSRDIVRSGTAKASIWASFSDIPQRLVQDVLDAGYACEGDLLLMREITADGKTSCRINGRPAAAATLRELCGKLINIHGQHDNQSLLNPAKHLSIVDAFAADGDLLSQYADAYGKLRKIEEQLSAARMDEGEKQRRLDLLQYQFNEIEAAALEVGEDEELSAQRTVIRNAEKIASALAAAYAAMNGDADEALPGAVDGLYSAGEELSSLGDILPEATDLASRLDELYYTAKEAASDVQDLLDNLSIDAGQLDIIEERLDLIYKLKKKYGPEIEDILAFGEKTGAEIEDITLSDERAAALEVERTAALAKATALAAKLTKTRLSAFADMRKGVEEALAFLNMPGIQFSLQAQEKDLGPDGADNMEFYMSTNPGEAPKPMARIASGGELSRIMLAIKSVLADRDEVPILIYDEVDAGISGFAAGRVGRMLQTTAADHQVICVTHIGQIAACGDSHLYIEKRVEDGRTFTSVRTLSDEERVEEIARMVQGEHINAIALENAREMLRMARQEK